MYKAGKATGGGLGVNHSSTAKIIVYLYQWLSWFLWKVYPARDGFAYGSTLRGLTGGMADLSQPKIDRKTMVQKVQSEVQELKIN
ncbi:hypothetical protein ACET7V_07175 [Aeromonas sanarellii]|uniref:Uncharacterized protein n=1 Tax=Aeromonas sanarellii TaxID=633415 RepID=A0ABS4B612_9GAMM|nr:hypothetical protein [Aeromonas sanarellii]MBP0602922.1 hypothetical protein [Aeromonas sanarellii]